MNRTQNAREERLRAIARNSRRARRGLQAQDTGIDVTDQGTRVDLETPVLPIEVAPVDYVELEDAKTAQARRRARAKRRAAQARVQRRKATIAPRTATKSVSARQAVANAKTIEAKKRHIAALRRNAMIRRAQEAEKALDNFDVDGLPLDYEDEAFVDIEAPVLPIENAPVDDVVIPAPAGSSISELDGANDGGIPAPSSATAPSYPTTEARAKLVNAYKLVEAQKEFGIVSKKADTHQVADKLSRTMSLREIRAAHNALSQVKTAQVRRATPSKAPVRNKKRASLGNAQTGSATEISVENIFL